MIRINFQHTCTEPSFKLIKQELETSVLLPFLRLSQHAVLPRHRHAFRICEYKKLQNQRTGDCDFLSTFFLGLDY